VQEKNRARSKNLTVDRPSILSDIENWGSKGPHELGKERGRNKSSVLEAELKIAGGKT